MNVSQAPDKSQSHVRGRGYSSAPQYSVTLYNSGARVSDPFAPQESLHRTSWPTEHRKEFLIHFDMSEW